MTAGDHAQPFHFEHLPIRGVWVRLADTWREVLARHHYPAPLRPILGEALAACALLTAAVKPPARLTFELRGDGPLRLVVADAWEGTRLRAIARWQEPLGADPLPALLGDGRALITLEPVANGPRHQGVVGVEAPTLAGVLENYFEQSEQLPTRVLLVVAADSVAGLLVQRLPGADDPATQAAWEAHARRSTAASGMLADADAQALLTWLYPHDDLRLSAARPLAFGCSCSLERVQGVLRALGREDLEAVLEERGAVSVDCEFCNTQYRFDAAAVAGLFDAAPPRLN